MGIMMKPTEVRAAAPQARFASGESCGSVDEDRAVVVGMRVPPAVTLEVAILLRSALSVVK